MARKPGISAADMEAVFAHALVQPKAKTGEGEAEERAAHELGLQVLGAGPAMPVLKSWRVRSGDGATEALITLARGVTTPEREQFAAAVTRLHVERERLPGLLPVRRVTAAADSYTTDLRTTGSARDLSGLAWSLRRRLEFVVGAVRTLGRLHELGLVHGCLCPDNIQLDDDLRALLAEAGQVDVAAVAARREGAVYEAYTAPERRHGKPADALGDLYSVGRILHELTADVVHPPDALLAIIRQCSGPPQSRFASAGDLELALETIIAELRSSEETAPPGRSTAVPAAREHHPRATPDSSLPPRSIEEPRAAGRPLIGLGLSGLALVVGSVGAAFGLGSSNDALRGLLEILLPLGAAMATSLVPGVSALRALGRVVLAAAVAATAVVLSPLPLAYHHYAFSRLHRGSAAQRAAIDGILRVGGDFRGASLQGVDLSGLDLRGTDFRRADARGANFSGAQMFGAEMEGASFEGADFTGADLTSTPLYLARMTGARCDEATRLPPGFACAGELVVGGAEGTVR